MWVSWVVAVVVAVGITLVPERFEASASIYVDTQTVLKPMMVGLAFQPDVEQQVRMLARTLISRPNVERLIDRPELGFAFQSQRERESTLNVMMQRIKVTASGRSNLYEISFRDVEPARARHVVEILVALFVESSASGKKRDSVDAGKFINEQIKDQEEKLTEAENRLKDFKVRNFGVTGVSTQDYFVRMSALSEEVTKLRNDLFAAEQSRDAYRRALAAEDPQLPAESLPGTAVVAPSEIENRIDLQRKQLDELLRRFTDAHPDVVNARRVIAQLEQQHRQDLEKKARDGGGRVKGTAATSPVYQKLKVSLAESEAQVASLRSQLGAQTERLAQTRALAGRVPQAEAELAQLNRDYDVIRKNYEQLVARRESALLGVKLDESSQLAEFRVVEPPRVSPKPVFPGRIHLALVGALVAALAGVAVALVMDMMNPTLADSRSLAQLSGRPVLGTVSLLSTEQRKLQERRTWLRFMLAMSMLIVFQMSWLAWVAVRSLNR
jgi:polysaccharide chain length determinant protein (PEP-CTERM system associated)